MSPLRLYASQLAAKLEAAEGSYETLANTNAILVSKLSFAPAQEQYERDVLRGTLSRVQTIAGKRHGKLSFEVEMRGCGGTPGTAPDYGVLLKGCGYHETPVTSTSVTYKPTTTGGYNSISLGFFADGVVHKLWGARGNVKFIIESGKPGIMQFEFTGSNFEVADLGLLEDVSYTAIVPPAFLATNLLVDSYAAIVDKIDIDTGNKIELRESINASSGYLSALITGRLAKGSMDVEQPLVGGYDFYGKWVTPGTLGSLSLVAGATGGNIVTVTCPKIHWAGIKPGDRNGLRTLGMDFEPVLNTADDEISIALT